MIISYCSFPAHSTRLLTITDPTEDYNASKAALNMYRTMLASGLVLNYCGAIQEVHIINSSLMPLLQQHGRAPIDLGVATTARAVHQQPDPSFLHHPQPPSSDPPIPLKLCRRAGLFECQSPPQAQTAQARQRKRRTGQ